MASPGGKEPLLSRRAGRLPPVNILWRPRSGTEREGGPAGSRPGSVADSPAAKPRCDHSPAPAAGPCAWGEAPRYVPCRYASPAFFPNDRTGRQRTRSGGKLPFRGMPQAATVGIFPDASPNLRPVRPKAPARCPKRKAPQDGEPDRGRLRRCLPALEGDMAGAAAVPWPYR